MNHELFTRMLFTDAIIGVGFPHHQVATDALRGKLAYATASGWLWNRTALEELPIDTLQDLYTGLKLHEVTHADQS